MPFKNKPYQLFYAQSQPWIVKQSLLAMKSYSETIEMKDFQQYFHMVHTVT